MNVIKKYIWLLQKLQQYGELTQKDFDRLWQNSTLSYGKPLDSRNFHRWKEAAEDLFSVDIECVCSQGQYRYRIKRNSNDVVTNWLLHTMTVSNLLEEYKGQNDSIILEKVPSGESHLGTILDAIKYGKQLMVTYHNFHREEANPPALVNPLCVKLSDRRWYVLVDFAEKENYRRIMALDRIVHIELQHTSYTMPENFDAKTYFNDSYGITVMSDVPTETVVLKVPASAAPYLRALPFHPSQRETRKEGAFVFMEYRLKITDELAFALLRHAVRSEIVEPASLREKVKELARQIIDKHNL